MNSSQIVNSGWNIHTSTLNEPQELVYDNIVVK